MKDATNTRTCVFKLSYQSIGKKVANSYRFAKQTSFVTGFFAFKNFFLDFGKKVP